MEPGVLLRKAYSPMKQRLSKLEDRWNDSSKPQFQPKRHTQMTKDIKKFIFRSLDGDPNQAARREVVGMRQPSEDIYQKISSTFNFTHHEGTDAKVELKVVKIVLVRESQLMNLHYLDEKSRTGGGESPEKVSLNILEVLAEIRESTLNYLEALCLWRQSIPDSNMLSPRVFFWEGQNYTLKIVSDLDFLADNFKILASLKIPAEQLRSNPLMLTNNLDDPNTWMDPVERAGQDCGGMRFGLVYEARLRLRFAERILLQEIELATNPSMDEGGIFLTNNPAQEPQGYGQFNTKYQPQYQQQQPYMKGASALEQGEGDDMSFPRDDNNSLNGGASMWQGDNKPSKGIMEPPGSGDSDSAVRSVPNSRSSSIYNPSAPSSRQGGSRQGGGAGTRGSNNSNNNSSSNSNPLGASGDNKAMGNGKHGVSGGGASGAGIASAGGGGGGGGGSSLDYGHDFFTGHWAESKAFLGNNSNDSVPTTADEDVMRDDADHATASEHPSSSSSVATEQQRRERGRMSGTRKPKGAEEEDGGIFFVDEGTAVSPDGKRLSLEERLDEASVESAAETLRSMDSVGTVEMHVISNIRNPPKNLLLAASACIILLAPGNEIPNDISWSAFLKLCNRVNISAMLQTINPLRVHKMKVNAIKPLLEQLLDEVTYDGFLNNETPLHEFTAVSKLVQWVQQFSTYSIHMQQRNLSSPVIQSPNKKRMGGGGGGSSIGGASTASSIGGGGAGGTGAGGNMNLADLPVTRKVIPSASLQLAPYFSQVVTHLHKHPLLVALLAPYEHRGTGRKKTGSSIPKQGKKSKSRLYEEEDIAVKGFDRVVVKVFDVINSGEFLLNIIIREYVILLDELNEEYSGLASRYFDPMDRYWWSAHIAQVLLVAPKPVGKLQLAISKKAIEKIIVDGIENNRPPHKRSKQSSMPLHQSVNSSYPTAAELEAQQTSTQDPMTGANGSTTAGDIMLYGGDGNDEEGYPSESYQDQDEMEDQQQISPDPLDQFQSASSSSPSKTKKKKKKLVKKKAASSSGQPSANTASSGGSRSSHNRTSAAVAMARASQPNIVKISNSTSSNTGNSNTAKVKPSSSSGKAGSMKKGPGTGGASSSSKAVGGVGGGASIRKKAPSSKDSSNADNLNKDHVPAVSTAESEGNAYADDDFEPPAPVSESVHNSSNDYRASSSSAPISRAENDDIVKYEDYDEDFETTAAVKPSFTGASLSTKTVVVSEAPSDLDAEIGAAFEDFNNAEGGPGPVASTAGDINGDDDNNAAAGGGEEEEDGGDGYGEDFEENSVEKDGQGDQVPTTIAAAPEATHEEVDDPYNEDFDDNTNSAAPPTQQEEIVEEKQPASVDESIEVPTPTPAAEVGGEGIEAAADGATGDAEVAAEEALYGDDFEDTGAAAAAAVAAVEGVDENAGEESSPLDGIHNPGSATASSPVELVSVAGTPVAPAPAPAPPTTTSNDQPPVTVTATVAATPGPIEDRPLSAIELVQQEFDELGDDDADLFNDAELLN